MAIAEVSVVPIGTGSTSISSDVARMQEVLEQVANGKIKTELNAMGTLIEGDMNDVMEVIKKLHEVPFEAGAGRVYTVIKIDDRRDKASSIEQKLESVHNKLNKI